MKIIIKQFQEETVVFDCGAGSGRATWRGETRPTSSELDVEVDVEDDLFFGKNLLDHHNEAPNIHCDGDRCTLILKVEGTQDNCIIARMAESIVLLDCENEFPTRLNSILLKDVRLAVYPTNI